MQRASSSTARAASGTRQPPWPAAVAAVLVQCFVSSSRVPVGASRSIGEAGFRVPCSLQEVVVSAMPPGQAQQSHAGMPRCPLCRPGLLRLRGWPDGTAHLSEDARTTVSSVAAAHEPTAASGGAATTRMFDVRVVWMIAGTLPCDLGSTAFVRALGSQSLSVIPPPDPNRPGRDWPRSTSSLHWPRGLGLRGVSRTPPPSGQLASDLENVKKKQLQSRRHHESCDVRICGASTRLHGAASEAPDDPSRGRRARRGPLDPWRLPGDSPRQALRARGPPKPRFLPAGPPSSPLASGRGRGNALARYGAVRALQPCTRPVLCRGRSGGQSARPSAHSHWRGR